MPLSKLFHKRNSVKDKRVTEKQPGKQENIASSTSSDSVLKDIQIESPSSEQLPLPTQSEMDVLFGEESKVVSAHAKQLLPPKTEPVTYDSKCQEDRKNDCTPAEQSSFKAENMQDALSDCYNNEVRKEFSTSIEQLSSTTGTVNKVSVEIQEDGLTSTEQLSSEAEENTRDISLENKDCALIEELSSKSETVNSVAFMSNEEVSMVECRSSDQVPAKGEGIRDTSLDIKTKEIPCEVSASAKLSPLKAENGEDILRCYTDEERNESCQSTEQSRKTGELCSNFKESDDSIGESIHRGVAERSSPKEKAELLTKMGNVKSTKSSNRSSSFKESSSKPNPPKGRRRKCESESAASNSADDEGFDDRILRFGVTDLEKMIGQCVNRLIRESIATAVRSVNVDSLCDEVMKSISDRSQSESSSETVEQRLHTNSVIEHADLEMMDTFENGESDYEAEETSDNVAFQKELRQEMTSNQENNSEGDGSFLEDIRKAVEEPREASGYHADSEESLSVHSITMETGREVKPGETPSENVISSGGNSKVGSSLLKLDSSLELNIEERNKTYVGNDIVDSSLKKDFAATTKSDVTNEIAVSSLKKDSAEESKSDATNKIVDSSLKTDSEEGSKPAIDEIADNSLNKDTEEVKRSDLTNEISLKQNCEEVPDKVRGMLRVDSEDLISMCDDAVPEHLGESDQTEAEEPQDIGANLPQQSQATDEEKKVNWKAGYLHVKLPHKSRGKGHLKAWKKRCVSIQPDEFAHSDPCLIVSVFSGSERKRGAASFWKSVSCQRAVLYRSSSSTQRYAFTLADEDSPVVHLAADSEADAQSWMAAMRAVLWPPSPVVELEKMLNGSQFEVSLIDNEFSYRAGLLGMYGHLTITQKKLILVHPQQGYVIQEWYLNTVDKFELTHQTRIEDVHKVLCMTTCSDSSTGKGDILIFCREAVALLQSLASTIHQILTYHSKQEGGKYQKELEEIAEWLVPSTSSNAAETEELYKVPPRQVRSLLDIPNFIFDKPLTPVASLACTSGLSMDSATNKPLSEASKTHPSRASQDSGISAGAQSADDFLNCSLTSFKVGGGAFHPASDSELSDSYTPPLSPSVKVKHVKAKGDA